MKKWMQFLESLPTSGYLWCVTIGRAINSRQRQSTEDCFTSVIICELHLQHSVNFRESQPTSLLLLYNRVVIGLFLRYAGMDGTTRPWKPSNECNLKSIPRMCSAVKPPRVVHYLWNFVTSGMNISVGRGEQRRATFHAAWRKLPKLLT